MHLLVSVVDAEEARVAALAGADIIDVKDPSLGALGDGPFSPAVAGALAAGAAGSGAVFVKLGLRHTSLAAAAASLRAARASVPPDVRLVVAGFADAARAGAPAPTDLPELAAVVGAQGCLLDTAVKDGRGLFHWLGETELREFVQACREREIFSALAGSLRVEDLARLGPIGPDLIGVRGAACVGDRVGGRVDADRVRALVQARDLAATIA